MAKEKKNEVKIAKKIEGEAWEKALDEVFKKKQKEVKVDGFRPGKVPRNVFEKKFGKESLFIDAADKVLVKAYEEVMKDSKLEPVVQPKVDLKSIDETGVEFEFTIITKPDVNVKKYKGLKVEKEKVKVTKEEIEHELGHVLEKYTEIVPKDGKVENGDIAIIDFEGFKDGVAFDGGKGDNYSLEIGSHTFIPGFEEQVIGMKAGDEKEVNVTFPEEYPAEDLKGQPVVFKVKCNDVKQKQTRELDAEFFEDLGMEGIDTKEKLEKEIESNIKANKEMDAENKYVDALLEAVGKNTEVDIPEEMVEEEVDRLMHRFEEQIKMQGISLEVYYQFTKSSEKDLRNQFEKEAFNNVLYRLMLEELISIEKLEVSDEDASKEAEELAKKYNVSKEEFLKQFGGIEMVKYDLEMRKAIDFLKENNK
ncbi:MAG: trigger factor [Bacilli bacterium]